MRSVSHYRKQKPVVKIVRNVEFVENEPTGKYIWGPIWVQFEVRFGVRFGVLFGVLFGGTIWGPIWGPIEHSNNTILTKWNPTAQLSFPTSKFSSTKSCNFNMLEVLRWVKNRSEHSSGRGLDLECLMPVPNFNKLFLFCFYGIRWRREC